MNIHTFKKIIIFLFLHKTTLLLTVDESFFYVKLKMIDKSLLKYLQDNKDILSLQKVLIAKITEGVCDFIFALTLYYRPADVNEEEYNNFYKSISKDSEEPLTKIHFTAEGEVTFKSILYIPKHSHHDMFSNYGKKVDHIKLYVRRVFITDDFEDMMPKYLVFVRGVVSAFEFLVFKKKISLFLISSPFPLV